MLVVVLPLAITHGTNNVRQLEDAWRKLAERHHLRYERSSRFKLPSISGEVGGRALLIKREPGQDTSAIRVQLTLEGPLPDGLHIGPHQARVEVLGHVLISGGINTRDAAFDEEVDVKGDDPDSIRQYLTDGRKRAAAQVVELGGELENGILIVPVNRDVETGRARPARGRGGAQFRLPTIALPTNVNVLMIRSTSHRSGASPPAACRAAAPR